eukprot:gb/GFBE01023565.1/.p1 GENE.gb/GFBE01023565.1/~~gb/GFBE01023565.1/.p1  ORF type:complete len:267 (+),score=45.90 gb/GFBE01023565.1/:1-801(+)
MVLLDWVNELMAPCFAGPCFTGPCFDCQGGKSERTPAALRTMRTPGHEVELAVSPLAGLRGFAGYHTSVLVAGEEYYFCPQGICCSARVVSHPQHALKRIYVGLSQASGSELLEFLTEHFRSGSYDLLRKNCNSFTDCALHFLCEQRLDLQYRTVEKLAWVADDSTGFLQSISHGEYTPNVRANDFDVNAVLQDIEAARDYGTSDSDVSEADQLPSADIDECSPQSGIAVERVTSFFSNSALPGVPGFLGGGGPAFGTSPVALRSC